ncbi:MAG: YdeI/OmpD-associated family protein [Rickettsiales bacterium]|jgi:uncharacterized protein YdeI (YjbR/CyaY-like superfamily)|nr:YdeI/OmpD-associated family protein [Rickettsiales bacterium]
MVESIYFNSRQEWRNWLFDNCSTSKGVWLIFHRKSKATNSGGIIYPEARDEALCFGWIDSTVRAIDDLRRKQYFSPRRPKSFWSKFNKNKIDELIEQGLMTPHGFETIERAKSNGSYFISDSIENLSIPEELERALADNPKARDAFGKLCASRKKRLLYGIITLITPLARERKINAILKDLGDI